MKQLGWPSARGLNPALPGYEVSTKSLRHCAQLVLTKFLWLSVQPTCSKRMRKKTRGGNNFTGKQCLCCKVKYWEVPKA